MPQRMLISSVRISGPPGVSEICCSPFISGTSVSWVGYIPVELPHRSASGTYTIDDGEPVNFNLAGLPADEENSQYNQIFFTTMEGDMGPHTLTVTFFGSEDTTPLTLGHLYINNRSLAPPPKATSITSIVPSPTTVANSDTGKRSGPNINAILGGMIGGLGFLIIITGAVLWRRHRRLSKETQVPALGDELASRHFNPYSEFQPNVGPNDVPTSRTPSPIPSFSMKAQETYAHAPVQSSPTNSLSADWRGVFGFTRRSSHGQSGYF
jgi:hypothetical protein